MGSHGKAIPRRQGHQNPASFQTKKPENRQAQTRPYRRKPVTVSPDVDFLTSVPGPGDGPQFLEIALYWRRKLLFRGNFNQELAQARNFEAPPPLRILTDAAVS